MLFSMASPKEKLVNVRLTPLIHEQFKIACDLKGASMSSLMHQFIVRTIREEKEREPQAFRTSEKLGNITESQPVQHRPVTGTISTTVTESRLKKKKQA